MEEKQQPSFLVDFLAGGTSGAIAKTLVAPIDRIKLLLQTQDAHPDVLSGRTPRYIGIVHPFRRVFAEQGLLSFYRGNGANVLRYFPTQAFNLAFKDQIKSALPAYDRKLSFAKFFMSQMAAGSLAGGGSLLLVYPLDFARTRLAADVGLIEQRQFQGIWDAVAKTWRAQGFFGLY